MDGPLRRHPPLITAQDASRVVGDDVVLAFNPGVVDLGGRLLMAFRADHGVEGDANITATTIGFAASLDGTNWDLSAGPPPIDRARALRILSTAEPHRDPEREFWRIYDPRLQFMPGLATPLVMSLAVDTTCGLRPALLGSRDEGETWDVVHLGLPDNRNVVLFPERIDGRVVSLERPGNEYGGVVMGAGKGSIWSRRSPDLEHWGTPRLVLRADEVGADVAKIGPGAPPVRTDDGWLVVFHVVSDEGGGSGRGWEAAWTKRYSAHVLLLALDDPSTVLGWSSEPVIAPHADHERHGYRNDVVFPGGALVRSFEGVESLWVYYGAADSVVGLATAPLAAVLASIDRGPTLGVRQR